MRGRQVRTASSPSYSPASTRHRNKCIIHFAARSCSCPEGYPSNCHISTRSAAAWSQNILPAPQNATSLGLDQSTLGLFVFYPVWLGASRNHCLTLPFEKRTKHTSATMIDQSQFYKQLTRALTPLALRESVEKGNDSIDDGISTWVCDFLAWWLLRLFVFPAEYIQKLSP